LALRYFAAPMAVGLFAAPLAAGLMGVVFGWFCVRLSGVYLAMLTLAFAQIVWSVAFQWVEVTGGDNGLLGVWPASWARDKQAYYLLALALCGASVLLLRRMMFSPFGFALRAGRDSPLRAEATGIDLAALQRVAFVIAAAFAGLAGGLFGIFNRGVFPDFCYWTKSAEPLIMTILGGMSSFWGPAVGALVFIVLNQQVTSYTEYWPFTMGVLLMVLLFLFPGGIIGALAAAFTRRRARAKAATLAAPEAADRNA
jgi:branched-chain amino acid transport system permease protein